MSKRDFYRTFNLIENQYVESVHILKNKQEIEQDGMVSPELTEEIKEVINPILVSYDCVGYMKFLIQKDKKLFDKEFLSIKSQFDEMQHNFESAKKEGYSESFISNFNLMLKKIFEKYEMWHYFKIILDSPNKKGRKEKYDRQNFSTFSKLKEYFCSVVDENNKSINELSEILS